MRDCFFLTSVLETSLLFFATKIVGQDIKEDMSKNKKSFFLKN